MNQIKICKLKRFSPCKLSKFEGWWDRASKFVFLKVIGCLLGAIPFCCATGLFSTKGRMEATTEARQAPREERAYPSLVGSIRRVPLRVIHCGSMANDKRY